MKRLWSPWRMPYIEGHSSEVGCLFCTRLSEPDGPENLILHRGANAFVILNRYPYTNGHSMVVPYAHVPTLEALDEATLLDLMRLTNTTLSALHLAYGAESFNIGANIGRPAGAGVEEHVHLHIVPRWPGDANFMATTAETRVIPESLDQTYARLLASWQELARPQASPPAMEGPPSGRLR